MDEDPYFGKDISNLSGSRRIGRRLEKSRPRKDRKSKVDFIVVKLSGRCR